MYADQQILGVDIGSATISLVSIDHRGRILQTAYRFHHGNLKQHLPPALDEFDLSRIGAVAATTTTPALLEADRRYDACVSVIRGARRRHPAIGSILLVGAENFGLIRLDANGAYRDYTVNTACAAGTGSFLDQQAARLDLSGAAELGRLALGNEGALPKIASRCAVFAKTDIVHAQQEGFNLAEICDGLCHGLARSIVDTLFARKPPRGPILFSGGVSRNPAVVKHIRNLTSQEVLADAMCLHAASGAALYLLEESPPTGGGRCGRAADLLAAPPKIRDYFHAPLALELSSYPDFASRRHYHHRSACHTGGHAVEVDIYAPIGRRGRLPVYVGLDIGSTSTKAAVTSAAGAMLAGFYTRTAGRPIEAVQQILAAVDDLVREQALVLDVLGVGTTGSGRKFAGRIIGADLMIDEISAHARAAVALNPEVDTIIEIGGQDAKFTTLRHGRVTFSAMNSVCAAGTGSFIEEQAQKLGCPLEAYADRAEHQPAPIASDRCTVFMERDLNHYLSQGYSVPEVLAAVLHSVRENYLTKVAVQSSIGSTISFQGATAKNRGLVAAFEQRLGKPIHVSRYCHLTGALGTALELKDSRVRSSHFRGFWICRESIRIATEVCGLCGNNCKISRAQVGSQTVAYGFLCGRDDDTLRHVDNNRSGFDLHRARKKVLAALDPPAVARGITIGLPAALHLFDDLPFWRLFFGTLGVKTVTSSNLRESVMAGKQVAAAEFCAPMAALHGHVRHLLERADVIFLPFYLDHSAPQGGARRQYCYYTQFAPTLAPTIAPPDQRSRFLRPVIRYLYSAFHTKAKLHRMLKGVLPDPPSFQSVAAAYDHARRHRDYARQELKQIYLRHTRKLRNLHVVLLGRPYTVLAKAMNKGIPELLAARGIRTFFQDMLPDRPPVNEAVRSLLRELHWHYAARILAAAGVVAEISGAYPLLITSFKCSPDSFVAEYFKKIMDAAAKPYLILQLDEHDSNVGYETRIEAALHAFHNHHSSGSLPAKPDQASFSRLQTTGRLQEVTLFIPTWDRIAARFQVANLQRAGIDARFLEESPTAIQKSLRYNTGQCIPLNIIAQEYMDAITRHDLDPARTALWMVAGDIACNLKLYPRHIKTILEAHGNGMEKAGVYVGGLSMLDISVKLPLNNYFVYMFAGMLRRMGCHLRPYECHKGSTDRVIDRSITILEQAFLGGSGKYAALKQVVESFASIAVDSAAQRVDRPKVAILGDLYARDNVVFNQDLIHFIETHGGRVITTPYSDYLKMVARPYYRKWWVEGHYLSLLSYKAMLATLKRKERRYLELFQQVLPAVDTKYADDPKQILARYNVRIENTGESMDNLLKIHYILKHQPDIALFVQTSPAFCCPALITEAMAGEIERRTGVPMVSITYDGTGGNKNRVVIPFLKFPRPKRPTASDRQSVSLRN